MYVRDGRRLQDIEEGAAFYAPTDVNALFGDLGSPEPRRILGVNENLLTRGFAAVGASDIAPPPDKPGYAPMDTSQMSSDDGTSSPMLMYAVAGAATIIAAVLLLGRHR